MHTRIVLSLFALSSINYCGLEDLCANTLMRRIESPDKRHVAVLFNRDCGATTRESLHISILPTEKFRSINKYETGNAAVVVSDRDVVGKWESPETFAVLADSSASYYKKELKQGRVSLVYMAKK